MKRTPKLYETAVVVNDVHCPYQDEKALKPVIDFVADLQPDRIIFNGDMIDFAGISRFSQNPLRVLSRSEIREISSHHKRIKENDKADFVLQAAMQRELNETYDVLCRFRAAAPKAEAEYVFGNHEYRLYRYLMDRAPELYGLTRAGEDQRGKHVVSLDYLLRFPELGIQKVFSGLRESYTRWGKHLLIGHFDLIRAHSSWTAKALADKKGISLIQAHTHRMGSFYKTKFGGSMIAAYENGCLCDLMPEYMLNPDWQHGFSVVHKRKVGDRFIVQSIPMVEYKFFYGGVEYSGTNVKRVAKGVRVAAS